jgi:hypothetical protein
MKTSIIRLMAVLLMSWASLADALAWDAEPDPVTGKYDKYFDRPTHFPDWYQPSYWPNNMAYFVAVRIGDSESRLENYEVAVYDQDNRLRHCGRSYAKDNHLCSLTIMGGEGDTFRFEILYGDDFDAPTIQAVPDLTVPFETDFVTGNKAHPYWLTLPDMTEGIKSIDMTRNSVSGTQNAVYDLQGRRVTGQWTSSPLQQPDLPKGLYIIGGRKYCVK